jgi:hypothetical protein
MRKPSLLLILAIMMSTVAFGQTATILGTVTDPSGSVVPAATATLTNISTDAKRVLQTSTSGSYVAPDLPIGPYALSAEAPGFKRYERTGIKIDSNDTVRVDAVLQVGQVNESVTVNADAIKVESDSSEVSDLISGTQVQELAINGRHMAALAILSPGAASDLPDFNLPISVGASTNISFNGQRPEHNVWMVDGGENYDRGCGGCVTMMPSVSAVSEFNTITSNASGDFGIGSGGTINMAINQVRTIFMAKFTNISATTQWTRITSSRINMVRPYLSCATTSMAGIWAAQYSFLSSITRTARRHFSFGIRNGASLWLAPR